MLREFAAIGALLGGVAAATIILACKPFAPGDGGDAAYLWTQLAGFPVGIVLEAMLGWVAEPKYADITFLVTAPILNGATAGLMWGLFVRRRRAEHPSSSRNAVERVAAPYTTP